MIGSNEFLSYEAKLFLLLYVILFFVAPIPFYIGFTTSFMPSTIAGIFICSILALVIYSQSELHIDKETVHNLLFIYIALLLHFIITYFYFQYSANFIRGFLSTLIMFIFITSSSFFATLLSKIGDREIDYIMKVALFIFFIIFFLSFFKPLQFKHLKSIFPYSEYSHFSLFFGGSLCYTAVRYIKYRMSIILFFLFAAIILQNLTLLSLVILISFCLFKFWMVFINVALGLIIVNYVDLSYFEDRLANLSSESSNLSALVFIQGWELAYDAILKSKGLGIGIQQLGEIKLTSKASKVIYLLTRREYNITDAGLTGPKIICEFGIFGLIVIIFFLNIVRKAIFYVRMFSEKKEFKDHKLLMSYCFLLTFLIELFVRGIGYFSGTVFMAIVAFIYVLKNSKSNLNTNHDLN